MTSQGEDTDEEYDDPIKLIDFEQARVRTEPHQKCENKFQHDGYDPADSDGDVLIEKEPLPSLGRFAVTLPVTFFDYTRNVSLLNKCKPFLIKVVDINKHKWYYKKLLANNVITNNTEVKRKESALDVHIEKVELNMRSESIKPKIRPVDITTYGDYNKVIKRNSSSQQIKHVKHDEKSCCTPRPLGFKKVECIDFKKNVGLIGLKISPTVDLNVSNAKVANARFKDKKEVQATVAKCGDSAEQQITFRSDKIINKQKLLLKADQDNLKLSSTNKNPSDGNVSIKDPSISLNDNKVNKEFNEKVESVNDFAKKNCFMNGYVNSNTEKNDEIKKAEKNPMLKEILTTSTSSPKSNSLLGKHIKFDPGILTTKGVLYKKTKLSFGSQKISKKAIEGVYIKDSKKKIKSTTQTVGKTKVQNEIKKEKKKAVNEKKDDGLDASKSSLGMNVTLNKDNILKMVISKNPNTSLNVNQNFDAMWNIKNLTTGDQTSKTSETMQESTCREELHNIYANIPKGKCLPNNYLLNNNNMFNYYQISSKNYPTIPDPSINPQVSQHNFRIPASENNRPSSFCGDNFSPSRNINAPIPKTNKPESHVISGAPSQISMQINSNNGNNAVLVQNIAIKDNSVIQRTLPQVTARHSNLPEIVQKKATSQSANVEPAVSAADKHTETKDSRRTVAFTDGTTNVKQVNSKEPASRGYGIFDSKGNVINRMSNQEIYVRRAVFKSNVMNNIKENSKAINQDLAQVVSERQNTPDIIVFNHQSRSSPINHSETHKIYVRRAVSKSNVHEEHSRIAVESTQVVPQRRNTSECAVINHLSNPSNSHSEHREIIARRKSDTTCSANIGNNSATTNKVNSKGYCNGPNSVPVMAALAAHLNETRVPSQAQGECHGTNSNQKDITSFAQRFPMTYTNNMGNFEHNMTMNQAFNVNESHYKKTVPLYQPMPQQHVDYQSQPIQTCIGNRPIQGQNRPTRKQRSMMNMTSADQGLPYPHMMQNAVPMNNVHCAPVYNSICRDMNLHNEGSYYNSNQSNALWSYLYAPPPPPPPDYTTGTFFPPKATVNASPQPTFIPSSVANSSSIIGCNNSGIIRKINIVAVPCTDKETPSNISSEFSNSDKPANSKLEMLEELSKVIMDIPPDSPVTEKNCPIYPLTKPDFSIADFSNRSDQSINVNDQSGSIPTTDKLKVGTLNSTNIVRTAPDQNVPTLAMSEHNISTHSKSNVSSSKLCSPIKSPSTQTTASPPKNVTEGSCTDTSTEKHNTTLGSSSSPRIQNFKRLHPTTEAQDKCPEMRKTLSSNPRVRPGPLSKKPKLSLFQKPSSPNRDPRGKLVLSAVDTGYSPPILPILTYEKTLEYIAHAHPETRNAAEKDDFTPNEDKLPVSILRNGISKSKCNKRKLFEEDKPTTQDKSVKKISLDEYKKRIGKNSEKDVNNITIKLECKTEKLDDTKQSSDLDLGYDSDSTMIL